MLTGRSLYTMSLTQAVRNCSRFAAKALRVTAVVSSTAQPQIRMMHRIGINTPAVSVLLNQVSALKCRHNKYIIV